MYSEDLNVRMLPPIAQMLGDQLNIVAKQLCAMDSPSGQTDEAVHKLRVSTRRAAAALSGLRPFLKKSRVRKMSRVLRRILQKAGVVRSADVQIDLLREELQGADTVARTGLEYALVRAAAERAAALQALQEMVHTHRGKRFRRKTRQLLKSFKQRRFQEACVLPTVEAMGHCAASSADQYSLLPAALSKAADTAMRHTARRFNAAMRQDLTQQESLHTLRVCGKRLRYTAEVFTDAIPSPTIEPLKKSLVILQDHLGALNDLRELVDRLERYINELKDAMRSVQGGQDSSGASQEDSSTQALELEAVAAKCAERQTRLHAEFHTWWLSPEAASLRTSVEAMADHETEPRKSAAKVPDDGQSLEPASDDGVSVEMVIIATNSGNQAVN